MTKKKQGRETKLVAFTDALKKLIANPHSNILTDKEIFEYINFQLEPEQKISHSTFDNYKAGKHLKNSDDALIETFLGLIKEFRLICKMGLAEKADEDKDSVKWVTWVLERKYSDLNLRQQHEHKQQVEVIGFEFKEAE